MKPETQEELANMIYEVRSWSDATLVAVQLWPHLNPAPAQGWRDISTAPKDGAFILTFTPGRVQDTMAWDEIKQCWMNGYDDRPQQPTHWQPLPTLPITSTHS